MAAKKARKTKKAPSVKQLAARRKFALAAKARSKAAKAKRPAKKAAKKRNAAQYKTQNPKKRKANKTIIKAKRVTILNLKKNPAFEILKEATPATKGSQSGWKLGKSFYAKGRGQAKLPGGALLDLGSGFVYRRVANPAKGTRKRGGTRQRPTVAKTLTPKLHQTYGWSTQKTATGYKWTVHGFTYGQGQETLNQGVKPTRAQAIAAAKKAVMPYRRAIETGRKRNALDYSPATPIEVTKHYRSGGPGYETKRQRIVRLGQRDLFAPDASIDELMGYLRKSNPSVITAVKRKMGAKAFAKASPSVLKREMKAVLRAELAKRKPAKKAAKKRVAARKAKRRNPNADTKSAYESFQGKPSTKSTSLNFPNGTPANVYKLGTLHSITLQSGAVVKPAGKTVWLCADTKGKLHLGTSGERLVNAPKGALGKVKEVEYVTTKPHLGDSKPTRYYHELGEETGQKPTLYSDGNGGLLFKGGGTYIRSDGIHN